jgi:hypothetical protein
LTNLIGEWVGKPTGPQGLVPGRSLRRRVLREQWGALPSGNFLQRLRGSCIDVSESRDNLTPDAKREW